MEASGGGALVLENPDSPCRPEDYVEVAGYRLVKPYHFDFCLSVRQRWIGQSIIDIFTREFPARDRAYYLQALADGVLRVEGCQVGPDTPLKDGHRMRHYIHRHEPPVPAGPIAVVGTSEAAVAVCKPAGMPVHVAGQYRKNTVLGVLQAERPDLGPLFPVHRLDKPVSGLLLFARSAAAAAALCRQIESRDVDKVYVARVLGRFSEGHMVADVPLAWDTVANHALAVPEAAVEAAAAEATADDATMQGVLQAEQQETEQQQEQQPAQQAGQQQGEAQQEVSMAEQRRQRKQQQKAAKLAAKGAKADRQAALRAAAAATTARGGKSTPKPALTEFRLLAVAEDGLTSIVECRPRTGRTHQIRVHLQHLGHPIANDTQYGGTYGGPLASRHMAQTLGVHWASQAAGAGGSGAAGGSAGGCCSSKRPRLEGKAEGEGVLPQEQQQQQVPPQVPPPPPPQQQQRQQHQQSGEEQAAAEPAGGGDADAYAQCRAFRCRPEFEAEAGLRDALCSHCPYYAPRDYPLDLRPLWLHARRYSCGEGSWSFSAPPPEWAHPDWLPPAPYDQQWHAAAAAAACGGGGGKLFPERL